MRISALLASASVAVGPVCALSHDRLRQAVDAVISPLMTKDRIPGMAVGIAIDGHSRVFVYGEESLQTHAPVTADTLFEIGSVSKTFTATLASYAVSSGHMALADTPSKYLPSLRRTHFGDEVSLLNLGTHTPGGLPLQVPADIRTQTELLRYLRAWRPRYPPGTYRTYSNVGIGLLGLLAARSLHRNFTVLMQQRLLVPLGLRNTFVDVPVAKMPDYAQGYSSAGRPARLRPGYLWQEAYGIRTTAGDMTRFLEINMGSIRVDRMLERSILATHTAYFTAGALTQDLIWEQYRYPVALKTLLGGNGPVMLFEAVRAEALRPPREPQANVWLNKTGSTEGFSAYVAFIPAKKLGVVILANKSYPIPDRVTAGYEILTSLAQ